MTLHDYIAALRKYWAVIVLLAVAGAGLAYAYAQSQPNQYRAQSSVIVIPARGDNVSELVQGSNYVRNLVQTYTELAISPLVLNPVLNRLDLDMSPSSLGRSVTVETALDSTIIRISATSTDPVQAQEIANAVAEELSDAVAEVSPVGADGEPAVRIRTISEAGVPTVPFAPNPQQTALIGLLVGAAIGAVFAVLRRLLATRLTTAADVQDITETPVLGEVYGTTGGRTLPSSVLTDPRGAVTESLRGLVAGLRFASVDGASKVLLVTSAASGEGKSSISVAMSLVLAESGNRVCLIDADLRRSSISTLTQLEGAVGLTSVLVGESTFEDALQKWGAEGVRVLTSGVLPPNPGQLLTSTQLRHVIDTARDQFDYVIIDSPPVLAVSDPLWIAPLADGVIVVSRAHKTRRDALLRTLNALEKARTRIIGVVLNGSKLVNKTPYYESDSEAARRRSNKRVTQRQWARRVPVGD